MMTKEEYEFLEPIKTFMTISTYVDKETKKQIYSIYNRITGENKKPNGCGKCFANVTRTIKHYFDRYTPIKNNEDKGHGI